jgi:hypothetical protein
MGKCKMCYYDRLDCNSHEITRHDFFCHELREKKDQMLVEFRKKNQSDRLKRDLAYEKYANDLYDFLMDCKCDDDWLAKRIALAKERRERGLSPWINYGTTS